MGSPGRFHCFITAFILLTVAGPGTLLAADLVVNNAANAACSSTATTPCFTTIQAAIDYASNIISTNTGTTVTFDILVEPGTYGEPVVLKPGISSIHGKETARTILNNASTAAVSASNVSTTNVSLKNLSFSNSSTGIAVSNSSSPISITNNVFYNTSGTAVSIQGSASTNVINNTFYRNGTAVFRDSASNQVTNNIFSDNTVNISQSTALTVQDNITYNDFNPSPGTGDITGSTFLPNSTIAGGAFVPEFVNISNVSNLDFHLLAISPCIGNGDPNQGSPHDIGAYGGTNADTVPMQVVSNITGTTSTSISLAWNANLSYDITGYRVYYGNAPGVYNALINVSTVTVATISGLSGTVLTPAKPSLNPDRVTVLNDSLVLNWDTVPGATGYNIYSDTDDGTQSLPTTLVATVNAPSTSFPLTGLMTNVKYKIAISAIAQAIYYVAVTSVNTSLTNSTSPGIANESAYSQEQAVPLGGVQESGQSNVIVDYPEALAAYPNLQNSHRGCFIATAAYGSYTAPEVQALRKFRDRYLLTNRAGSVFVRWYYENGPIAAAWLEAHPGYKPVVRTALMPAVGLALFMTGASLFIKTVIALFMLIAALMIAHRFAGKKMSGPGGT